MTWFMPSWGRPQRMKELLKAPGGWPQGIIVQVNEDDPTLPEYQARINPEDNLCPWRLEIVPAGSRCSDVHRLTYERHPHEYQYGFLMDDLWPLTANWWSWLEAAAGRSYFAIPQGPGFPKRIRTAFVMGGDIVRAMGSVVPIPLRHWCEDCLWDDIATTLNIMRPVKRAVVDHRNFEFGLAKLDDTYKRGREFIEEDTRLFAEWMASDERVQLLNRVAAIQEQAA